MATRDVEVTAQIITEFIARRAGRRDVPRTVHLFDTGLISSLFLIELLSFLQSRFDLKVSVEDLDLETFSTVDRIARFVVGQPEEASP